MKLDFALFEKELYEASYRTIDAIRKDCKGEHLYSFALVTTGLFGYVFPNANTEEGLMEAAKQYLVDTHDFDNQLDLAVKLGRWEPTVGWRFFGRYINKFNKVNRMLEEPNMEDVLSHLSEIEFEKTTTRIEGILFHVLKRLRKDGHFGKDKSNFYINITYQDQDYEDLHRCASRVNPKKMCNKIWIDLSDVLNYWYSKKQNVV